jgi:hypothetical protein
MNPELLHIAARSQYQERLGIAQHEHRVERVRAGRTSGLGQAIRNMRINRRRRTLAIRTAAFGRA